MLSPAKGSSKRYIQVNFTFELNSFPPFRIVSMSFVEQSDFTPQCCVERLWYADTGSIAYAVPMSKDSETDRRTILAIWISSCGLLSLPSNGSVKSWYNCFS